MPKIVDPQQRRALIVDAVFRLVARGGIEAATLRGVADETGLAIGSVRHYFDNHDAIIVAAAREMTERVGSRLLVHRDRLAQDASIKSVLAALEEFLPLDGRRLDEVRVWVAFTAAAPNRPALADFSARMRAGTTDAVRRALRRAGAPTDSATVTGTVAVIDGLCLAGTEPKPPRPQEIRAALRAHIERICGA